MIRDAWTAAKEVFSMVTWGIARSALFLVETWEKRRSK